MAKDTIIEDYETIAKWFQAMMNILEDVELAKILEERANEEEIEVDIADL